MATKTKTTKITKPTEVKKTPAVKAVKVESKTADVVITPGKGRIITGKVVSDKMMQTVVVEVTRLVAHPVYQKRMRKTNKFHAHNTMGAKIGNLVEITECKPISKTKFFIVSKIIS